MVDTPERREFHLLPELRRSALWAIGGCLLIAGLLFVIQAPKLRGLIERAGFALPFILGAIWLFQYRMSRLRVDADGISKRVLWWWDLWPWEAFTDGRIHQGITQHGYEFPTQPWWSRKLELGLLPPTDAREVDSLIRRVWQPPEPAPRPEVLKIKLDWPRTKQIELTPQRIVISRKQRQRVYRWQKVSELVIWRLESGRRDFRELHLVLDEEALVFRRKPSQGSEASNWTGVPAEVLSSYLINSVCPERVQDFALTGESNSLDEVNARANRSEKERHELTKIRWSSAVLFGFAAVILVLILPWPKKLFGLLYCPVIYAYFCLLHKRIAELDQQLLDLESERKTFTRVAQVASG